MLGRLSRINFTACRVLAYCFMGDHLNLLLEVPLIAEGGLSDEELLKRLGVIRPEVVVASCSAEIRVAMTRGWLISRSQAGGG